MTTPKVAVLVLTYNGVELTQQCLLSLRASTYANLDIWIVDNASTDRTLDTARREFPEARLLALPENLGYAGGNNAGMRAALAEGADLIFLANNDTRLEPDCLTHLVNAHHAHPRAGMLGPMVYTWEPERLISSAGGQVLWQHADAINIGMGQTDAGQYPARPVDFVNGCGLLVTRTALDRAGMLDESFFMYWEETDWGWRTRRAGFELWFEPAARMYHKAPIHHRDLGPTTLYYVTRNRLRFFARHTPWPIWPLAMYRALAGALRGIRKHQREGRPEHARATQWAIRHALQRQWGKADATLWKSDASDRTLHSAAKPPAA